MKLTDLLSNANKEIEKTIRVIRETQAEKEPTREARKELDTFKKEFPAQGNSRKCTLSKPSSKR